MVSEWSWLIGPALGVLEFLLHGVVLRLPYPSSAAHGQEMSKLK